ncbi:MAG: SpoIIE family protein phosphatase [Candidatus Acidiferrales bacterium]|jgi:phosphoserine phosphatase RsbU/P
MEMDPVELKTTADVPAEVLSTLAEIGREINASLNLDEVLARTAALVKNLIDYEIFAVLLPEEGSNRLYFRFAIGHHQDVVEHWRIPIGEGITGTAAATGRPVLVGDVRKDPRYLNAMDSVQSELAVPLMVKGVAVGVLDISSRQLDYFTPLQQNILTLLASRIAGAIENARLFERVQRQADTLLILNEVAREASSVLEVAEVLRRAAELTKRIIDYQIFSILLFDPAARIFRQRITVKFGQHIQEKISVPIDEGIVGAAAALLRPVVVPDVERDPRYIRVNDETRSELAVPLVVKNRIIGVMDLESPTRNYFTADHVQALSILAANLAVAIENAQLYERVARDEARMDRDLSAARRLQGALLPRTPSADYGVDVAARVVSSRELNGDMYDFLRYGPQELGIAMGDVSGKGSAAALFGAVAIGTLRSMAPQKLQPAEMLRNLNTVLGERRVEGRFITMCYATWHRGRRRVRIANAGQVQPFLYSQGSCQQIKLTGFPLGMFDDVSYEEVRLNLEPGNILVFYSDGIDDTTDSNGVYFGSDRVCELVNENFALTSAAIAERILEAVDTFSGGAHAFDDRTLVVVKVL